MRALLAVLFCLFSFAPAAQNLTGKWVGKLTQQPGGMLSVYNFEIYLQQTGNQVVGYSIVSNPNSAEFRARILLKGTFDGIFFTFRETEIAEEHVPTNYYWCIKRGTFMFKRDAKADKLSGKWDATNCPVGEAFLERANRDQPVIPTKPRPKPANPDQVVAKEGKGAQTILQEPAPPKPVDKKPGPPPIDFAAADQGKQVVLEQVHFERSLASLLPAAYPQLDALANYLLANPSLKVEVAGHTDNVGPAYKNRELSHRRAERVVQYLVAKGVEKARLQPQGYGGAQPRAPNDTEENRQKNRRVEFKWIKN
jgi:outer membrane protein OmpA-like peptidoglycan-associated protein